MRFTGLLLVTGLLVAGACSPAETSAPTPSAATQSAPRANPPATPGLVRWHESVETAKSAAAASGKPLLVFQLLGRLDDELC